MKQGTNSKKNFRRVASPLVQKYFRGTDEDGLRIFDAVPTELKGIN
jgi:hypothetical protein